ncbi:MAG: hypothetical protein H0X38_18190 [Planctomycetes bacterium]|nr:hypothetical protein [Planctomycetota bacterium]
MSFLREHWELKLVALVIAIALWIYTNGQVRIVRPLLVRVTPAAVQSLPEDYRVATVEPAQFTVFVNLPEGMLHVLRSDLAVPRLVIAADSLGKGRQSFPITNRLLGLDEDFRIERVDPDGVKEITVAFDRVDQDEVPVEIPQLLGVPEGIEAAIALSRTRVKVRGAHTLLQSAREHGQRILFKPIALGDIDKALATMREERLELTPLETGIEVMEPVVATVTLRPAEGGKQVVSLPVQIMAPRDVLGRFQFEISQAQVALTIRGPLNVLRTLHPETDLGAYVTLRASVEPGVAQELPVTLVAHDGLTADPATVRVTATLR